jgi:hypothetical protein
VLFKFRPVGFLEKFSYSMIFGLFLFVNKFLVCSKEEIEGLMILVMDFCLSPSSEVASLSVCREISPFMYGFGFFSVDSTDRAFSFSSESK